MTVKKRLCAFPGCEEEATFPAPVSPEKLRERIYFCLDHVREYNKKWNGLSGFSGDEIFVMQQGAYWNRPTWSMGLESKGYKTATAEEALKDPFRLFEEAQPTPPQGKKKQNKPLRSLPGQIREACYTLGTKTATDIEAIKKAYRQLVKQHHPDVQNTDGTNTPGRIQKINEAYRTLLLYAKRNT